MTQDDILAAVATLILIATIARVIHDSRPDK
jgi:hypothetical protein